AQASGESASKFAGFLQQAVVVTQNAEGPLQNPFAFRRQAFEPLGSPDQQQAQVFLELFESGREGRLRHAAGGGGAREVFLSCERHQILEIFEDHGFRVLAAWSESRTARKSWSGCDPTIRPPST